MPGEEKQLLWRTKIILPALDFTIAMQVKQESEK